MSAARFLAFAILALVAGPLAAADPPLTALRFETGGPDAGVTLAGTDSTRQLLVTGLDAAGKARDLTRGVAYSAHPAGVVAVDAVGFVTPLADGTATVTASAGGLSASVAVTVSRFVDDVPVHFENQVVPVFTKFGCNSGGCHGKADGQNGFKLSLLGFEPREDYEFVAKESRGRRLFAASPENSLLLRKATGAAPHGGGKKLDPGSPFYRVLARWVSQGAGYGTTDGGLVTKVEVFPKARLLARGGSQQLVVLARHADGTTTDVTRMTQFDTNAPDLAEVSPTGLVTAREVLGTAAVMVRYQSQSDVFRATVPLGAVVAGLPKSDSFVDALVFQRLVELGLPPSPVCDDATFLRRVTLDIAGRLPTPAEVATFLTDSAADKRAKLVDALLASPDYADYFANKWGAVLRNRRRSDKDDPRPTAAFRQWIEDGLAANKPYDQFVREVLTVTGAEVEAPPVVWYREVKDPTAAVEDAAQLFLGQRIGCARCHHHPFERWGQQDYWGMAAFFSTFEVKEAKAAKKNKGVENPAEPTRVLLKGGKPQATNPRTGKPVPPTGLGAAPVAVGSDEDPRAKLADWMTDPANPFFAKALVNRYWKHFLGRGLVDPEDDMRATNPPTNPELLDALAKSFADSKFDLKALVRTICNSKTYQLSAVANAHNAGDTQNYSRFIPRRLPAEVLLDAVDDVTGVRTKFKKAPADARAVQLPDNMVDSYFLSVFGKPDATSACECERNGGASLAQALHMFNSQEMAAKVAGKRAQDLARDKRPHPERLGELYVVALGRKPSAEETAALVAFIEGKADTRAAYEDVVWAVLNMKEFLFNH